MANGVLEGLNVISMGSAWAGPYVGRVLAEMGARVFRIAVAGPSWPMGGNPETIAAWKKVLMGRGMSKDDVEKAVKKDPGYVGNYHCNNYALGLDLRNPLGKEIYRKLAKITDIVVDGWSPRVMKDLGLDYPALKEINPGIIYLSMPGMGMFGPEKDVRMWGTGCEALGGLTSVRGYLDGPAHRAANFIVDGISSPHILASIMAVLNYRAQTGKGQWIDCAQAECATFIMKEAIMDYTMNGRVAKPQGNRHPAYAPHNAYRCQGDDLWVTIAVTNEAEWQGLCQVMGNPEWTKDAKFADMYSRWQNQAEMDKLIEAWTSQHEHYALQDMLQQRGVPAAAVATLTEHILYDPQVKDRNVYTWLKYHDGVADPVFRVPWVFTRNSTALKWCGPHTGQHNDYVLKQVLGYTDAEAAKFVEAKAVGVTPPDPL